MKLNATEQIHTSRGLTRRRFLIDGAVSLGAFAIAGMPASSVQADQTNPKSRVLHIIGHSHIDAAWLWPWRDGSNVVLNTFRSALDRMNETPAFRYVHSSSAHYQWVERADPKMFAEVRARIKEGRWEAVGGWPVEPDCNIPSTESFVRHCLYGKNYLQRALNVDTKIGFNPDSFGHAAGLPAILRGAGYRYYVFMRPQEHEMKLPLLFWWEAPDGSRVLALRIRRGYSMNAERIPDGAQNNFQTGFNHAAYFLGVGDHGGAVTKAQIAKVAELQQDASLPELRWSTLTDFLTAVEQSPAVANLPVVRSELQYHSRGCYSAYGEGKQLNRRAERWLGQAETISTVASLSGQHVYPSQEYPTAWWKVLFNQFHDLLAGTAMYTAYRDSRDSLGWACETAQTSRIEALESMARRVDLSTVKEGAVFAFNPLPWPRKVLLEYHTERNPGLNPWVPAPAGIAPITHLESSEGEKFPLQFRPSDSMTQIWPRLSSWLDLPACGYRVFELIHGTAPDTPPYSNFFSINEQGFGVSSLKSADGKELLAGPIGLVVIGDPSDTWGHGITRYRQEIGRPQLISSQQIEDGPVTRVTRQRAKWNNSEIVVDIAQFKAIDVIEFRFVIDWHEREQILKLEIPTAMTAPRVFVKVAGATIERQPNGDEESYQDWV
ncbi:MAG TPA: glycoside hydrolase family 38 C-terminal domain-containing protein, partial [Pyrinomonadaceae bacterium]